MVSDGVDVAILNLPTIAHVPRALDLKPVIEHINLDFTAQQDVATRSRRPQSPPDRHNRTYPYYGNST